MTRAEKNYIINEVIRVLNDSAVRGIVRGNGRSQVLKEIADVKISDDFPELLPSQREDILEYVEQQAMRSQYPKNRLQFVSNKLNFGEVLLLTNLLKKDLTDTATHLEELAKVMSENEDERGACIGEALSVIRDILSTSKEPIGENI